MSRKLSSTGQMWIGRITVVPMAAAGAFVVTKLARQSPPLAKVFIVFWSAILIYNAITFWRFRSVELDGNDLIISDLGKTIRVPLNTVESVSGGRGGRNPIKIVFRTDTDFGQSIRFLPVYSYTFMWPWSVHPLVKELQGLVRQNGGSI